MDKKTLAIIVLAIVAVAAVAAVFVLRDDGQSPAATPPPTPVASASATPAAETPAPEPSSTPTTPPPADVEQLSQEDAAQTVDTAVSEANSAVETADQTAQTSADDGELTAEEEAAIEAATAQAVALVDYAAQTAAAYEDVYADATGELVAELDTLESDLAALTADLDELLAYLEKGEAAAAEATAMISAAADSAAQLEQTAGEWSSQLADLVGQRANTAVQVMPTEVSKTRAGALASLKTYLQTAKGALADGGFSSAEIEKLSQAGANAAASLQAAGGALAGLSGQVQSLTQTLAVGDLPAARQSLPQLEQAIPSGIGG